MQRSLVLHRLRLALFLHPSCEENASTFSLCKRGIPGGYLVDCICDTEDAYFSCTNCCELLFGCFSAEELSVLCYQFVKQDSTNKCAALLRYIHHTHSYIVSSDLLRTLTAKVALSNSVDISEMMKSFLISSQNAGWEEFACKLAELVDKIQELNVPEPQKVLHSSLTFLSADTAFNTPFLIALQSLGAGVWRWPAPMPRLKESLKKLVLTKNDL